MSKFLHVSNSKYRTVISEILPYEHPVFFTNRYFARFLKYYGVKVEEGVLVATHNTNDMGLKLFLDIMGGKKGVQRPCFQYSITKDGHEKGRRLTIVHPYHQVQMAEFYDRYKTILIELCQRSNFSIRFPYKVATYQKKQKGYHKIMSDDAKPVDTRESLKHFFAYKYYKNINFFYDDYRFLKAEKKFCGMVKLDLKHCFENIEPEQLSTALFDLPMNDCDGTIASNFYNLQMDFQNKEDGIVIGPEFSRLYAELILQRIDKNIEKDFEKHEIHRNADYIFYRYVDDGFLFYNDEKIKDNFLNVYTDRLNEYGQSINEAKIIELSGRPFMEPISSVKIQLLQIVDEHFQNRLETFKGFMKSRDKNIDTPVHIDYKDFINKVRSVMRIGNTLIKYKE